MSLFAESIPKPSSAIRAQLDHPVIDGDGHMIEAPPVLLDYVKDVGGAKFAERFERQVQDGTFWSWNFMSRGEREHRRITRPPFWFATADAYDRATSLLPGLLRTRLDNLGIDYSLLYTTVGLWFLWNDDPEIRRVISRAMNLMNAEVFASNADRMAPVALIPMHSPNEALEELDFAVHRLGFKAIMIAGAIRRTVPAARELPPELAAYWIDPLALDSAYDYDPVWQRCVDLKVAPTDHTGSMGWVNRASISNYNFNHIGHFAAAHEVFCKALFFGGVTQRFPNLNFAFLEGGVGWACSLFNDLVGHWEKRNGTVIDRLDPERIDREMFVDLIERYGDERILSKIAKLQNGGGPLIDQHHVDQNMVDEWMHCGIEKAEDIYDRFVPRFYFGCEGDDRTVAWAFDKRLNRFGARIKAMFSSDIGHWDVADVSQVLAEAYELVESGAVTPEDFRDFVFTNPVELHTRLNPGFFEGTSVEADVASLLERKRIESPEKALSPYL